MQIVSVGTDGGVGWMLNYRSRDKNRVRKKTRAAVATPSSDHMLCYKSAGAENTSALLSLIREADGGEGRRLRLRAVHVLAPALLRRLLDPHLSARRRRQEVHGSLGRHAEQTRAR